MNDILNRYLVLKKSNDDLIKNRIFLEQNYEQLKKKSLLDEK